MVTSQVGIHKVLDYGCGSGAFIAAIQGATGIEAIGYEPFMSERVDPELSIFNEFSSIEVAGPFDIIVFLETVEHLEDSELKAFLARADGLLTQGGRILISAPIEIGPALLLKETNRCFLHRRLPENSVIELFLASFFGVPARRAQNIKGSHKGFDFRRAIRFVEEHFGPVTIASYGPLPLGTWYGNSQVFFWLKRGTS